MPEILWFSCDGMMVIDEHRRILAVNPAMEKLTKREARELVGKSECGLLLSCRNLSGCPLANHPEACPGLQAMETFRPVPASEYTIRDAQGKGIVVSTSYTPIQLPGRLPWAVAIFRDITEPKKRERLLQMQAKTDPLTGLPNRWAFLEGLAKELSRAQRHGQTFGLGIADIDGFKLYNDTYGHPAGDDLLRALANLLRAGRRTADTVARYGGDEFAFLLPATDTAGGMAVMERSVSTVSHFSFVGTGKPRPAFPQIRIGMSAGLAGFPEDGRTAEALIAAADRRLYEAKQAGGNRAAGAGPAKKAPF